MQNVMIQLNEKEEESPQEILKSNNNKFKIYNKRKKSIKKCINGQQQKIKYKQ